MRQVSGPIENKTIRKKQPKQNIKERDRKKSSN